MRWRRPEGLLVLEPSVGTDLARLTGLESFARAVMAGVVPLAAYEAFGSKQAVSYVFIGGALITVLFTLNVGAFERRLAATLGGHPGGRPSCSSRPACWRSPTARCSRSRSGSGSAEASIFSVCLSLYIMDYIGKRDLTANESRRIVYSGMAWLVGPTIGVWLWSRGVDDRTVRRRRRSPRW